MLLLLSFSPIFLRSFFSHLLIFYEQPTIPFYKNKLLILLKNLKAHFEQGKSVNKIAA
jgi:hypothetical protein